MFPRFLTTSAFYLHSGDQEKATALVREAYRRHPQYLFAKVNYANLCLQQGEIGKVPGIFDHACDLQQLYPHRTRFHVSECTGFAWVMCRYFCAIGERETAALYYQMLKQVAPRHPMTKQAQRSLYPPFWVRWLRTWAEKRLLEHADTPPRSDTTYSSSHMTLHHIEVVSLKSNLSVASVVSAKSFETGSRMEQEV